MLDEEGRDGETIVKERRVDAAFEPLARIAGERERLARPCNRIGGEIGAFDDDVGRLMRDAGMLAAHDTADVVNARLVGDDGHAFAQRIGLAVQRLDRLSVAGGPRDEATGQLRAIIDVQRAPEVDGHVVCDIDQRRNRLLPDRRQPLAHPVRRLAIGETSDRLRIEGRAAGGVLDPHIRTRALRLDRGHGRRNQRAEAGGGEVAGDAVDAHAILPVGRDRHVDDRIVQPGIVGIGGADRCVLGQFDDAVMAFADLQLARRTHHAVRFDTADRRDLQRHVEAGDIGTRRAEHTDQPGACVGRTADDLHRTVTGINAQHLQLVRLRVTLGGKDARDAERL